MARQRRPGLFCGAYVVLYDRQAGRAHGNHLRGVMAQLDKLIEKIQPNQEIIMESGKPPVLKSDTGAAPMLR